MYALHDVTRYKPSYCGALLLALEKPTTEQILLAYIGDKLANLVWMLSEDGAKGRNAPDSVTSLLLRKEQPKQSNGYKEYDTPEALLEGLKKYERNSNSLCPGSPGDDRTNN